MKTGFVLVFVGVAMVAPYVCGIYFPDLVWNFFGALIAGLYFIWKLIVFCSFGDRAHHHHHGHLTQKQEWQLCQKMLFSGLILIGSWAGVADKFSLIASVVSNCSIFASGICCVGSGIRIILTYLARHQAATKTN